jgi:putative SOS response-associated peptidase YedK
MCGRYALDENPQALLTRFGLLATPAVEPRWNIAPGSRVLAIRADLQGRVAQPMVLGLEPPWARREGGFAKPINARAETLAQRPMFRSALRRHRCILPASGFYEWQVRASAAGAKARKQPWYVHPAGGGVFALAGLYEPGTDEAPPTCCIVTADANDAMAAVHERMPVILDDAGVARWLDPGFDPAAAPALLRPCPSQWLVLHAVGTAVNAVRHDGPELIRPVDPGA